MGRPKIKIDWIKVTKLYDEGKSINQIAKDLGYKMITLNERMKLEGFRIRPREFYKERTLKVLNDANRRLIKEGKKKPWNKGITGGEFHKHYTKKIGVKNGFISKRRLKVDKKKLLNLYVDKKESIRTISEEFNCNPWVIAHRIKEIGIPIRQVGFYTQRRFDNGEMTNFKEARKLTVIPAKDTTIEVKIQNFLKKLGIEFFTHQHITEIEHGYQCDILIPSMNLVIECDGDYWHKYPTGREIDSVRTSELIEKGFKVLRLWECEIKPMKINKFRELLNEA